MSHDALSALLDGECSTAEIDSILDEMRRSPELAQRWSRMCVSREAAQGTKVSRSQPCICAGVMSRLDAAPEAPGAKVVDLAVRKAMRQPNGRPSWASIWKPAAGLAAAASVGAAAVLFIRPAEEIGATETLAINDPAEVVDPEEQAYRQMLREYVMDHSNSLGDDGMGGTLRYARFAAHTAAYHPLTDAE